MFCQICYHYQCLGVFRDLVIILGTANPDAILLDAVEMGRSLVRKSPTGRFAAVPVRVDWAQVAWLKAPNANSNDYFGYSIFSVSKDMWR